MAIATVAGYTVFIKMVLHLITKLLALKGPVALVFGDTVVPVFLQLFHELYVTPDMDLAKLIPFLKFAKIELYNSPSAPSLKFAPHIPLLSAVGVDFVFPTIVKLYKKG